MQESSPVNVQYIKLRERDQLKRIIDPSPQYSPKNDYGLKTFKTDNFIELLPPQKRLK